MRILRLHFDDGSVIEFHPFVTVARELDGPQRAAIAQAFSAAVSGRTVDLPGLIEVHDVVLDLDDAALELLELPDVPPEVVVTMGDLPGTGSSDVDRQLRAAERRLDLVEDERRALEHRLESAEAAAAAARAALHEQEAAAGDHDAGTPDAGDGDRPPEAAPDAVPDDAELRAAEARAAALAEPAADAAGEVDRCAHALREAEARHRAVFDERAARDTRESALRNRLDELRRLVDVDARETLDQAEAALAAFDAQPGAEEGDDEEPHGTEAPVERSDAGDEAEPTDDEESVEGSVEADEPVDVESRIAELETETSELRTGLALQESLDPGPIRSALDAARAGSAITTMVASPEALGLADRLEDLDRRIEQAAGVERPLESEIDAAARRVADAEAAYQSREAELRGPQLTTEDRHAIEQRHAEVLDAEDELDNARLRRGRAQAKLDEARAAEAEVLEHFGFASYTDFLTSGAGGSLDAEGADQLQQDRVAVLRAEAELRELQDRVVAREALDEMVSDREQLRASARELLGEDVGDAGLVDALVAVRVEVDSSEVVRPLVLALEQVGLRVSGLDLNEGEIIRMGVDWLDEHQRAEELRREREDRLEAIEAELRELRGGGGDAPVETRGSGAGTDEGGVDLVSALPGHTTDHFDLPYAADDEGAPDTVEVDESLGRRAELVETVEAARRRLEESEDAAAALAEVEAELASLPPVEDVADEELDRLRAAAAEAAARHDQIEAERRAAEHELVRLRAARRAVATRPGPLDGPDEALATRGADAGMAAADMATLREEVDRADETLAGLRAATDDVRDRHETAMADVASLRRAAEESDDADVPIEEIEWYLLGRLATLRDVCFAGSLPLVIDGALDHLGDRELLHVLDRLERMAGDVQLVHLSHDRRLAEWAERAGEQRAAVVAPLDPAQLAT